MLQFVQGWCPYFEELNMPFDITFFFYLCGGALGTTATTGLLYQPRVIGDGDCGEIGGMKIDRENRSTRRKPATASLCPPQIPHDYLM
jgi:hypothetical protein